MFENVNDDEIQILSFCEFSETQYWFDEKNINRNIQSSIRLSDLCARDSGLLVNDEVKIVAEIDVLEVVGELDVPVVSTEIVDINGFQVLASQVKKNTRIKQGLNVSHLSFTHITFFFLQVEAVNILFKKHPDIASNVRAKNLHLRTTYLNVLLGLTKILCKSSEELSDGDLSEAYSALSFVIKAGFKLDWLEKALKEACEIRSQEIEEKLNVLSEKRADMDALLKSLNDEF